MLIFSVALGLSTAATATVARRVGERDPEDVSIAAVQAIVCGLAISIIAGTGCAISAPHR